MRGLVVLGLGLTLLVGCAGEKSSSSSTTGPTGPELAKADGSVTAEAAIRDRFLFDHNPAFNGGLTFRWEAPIPIFILTGDAVLDDLLMQQFVAWEVALAGAGGMPMYQPQPITNRLPPRGIVLTVADLPGNVVGLGDPFSALAKAQEPGPGHAMAQRLRQLSLPQAPVRRLEIPELSVGNTIERCLLVLDPAVLEGSVALFTSTVRHEVGHCLGFIGHVSNRRSLMHASSCCPLTITSDVSRMMRRLYGLPPGTEVRR
jgi:hypothetical protein